MCYLPCTDHPMWDDGTMSDNMYDFPTVVFLRHPVIILHVLFRAVSRFWFAWAERHHIAFTYSVSEKHRD